MSIKIITSGVDSEYVLSNLSNYLRKKEYEVVEIDFGKFVGDPYKLLSKYLSDEIIYITSAHTNLSLRLASYLVPSFTEHYPNYLSPLEIIAYLKPILSIYVPHDLLTPYGDTNLDEYRFLDVYDYILTPYNDSKLQNIIVNKKPTIYEAGWIKFEDMCLDVYHNNEPIEIMLFISMVEHLKYKYGVEGFVNYLRPLLQPNVHIKLPVWNGMDIIEKELKNIPGIKVISANEDTINLIKRSKIVICNGASSIHAESALLGKPTICILDNEGISSEDQKNKLQHLPNIYFYDYSTKQAIPTELLESISNRNCKPLLKKFDYDFIDNIIRQSISENRRNLHG